jgi:hypothetical protein
MTTTIAFLVVWLAAAQVDDRYLRPDDSVGGALVSNAVTVEGTAAIEVKADAARLEYVIENGGNSPSDSLAGLKNTRDRFAKAIGAVTGLKIDVTFEPPQVTRRERKDANTAFTATQKAVARLDNIPRDARDLEDYLARLIASVAESGVTPAGVAGPEVVFEISTPDTLEEGLMADAVKDASKRSELAAKALHRRLSSVRSAFFESFVTVKGERISLDSGDPVESKTPEVTILYTVRIAYALEL